MPRTRWSAALYLILVFASGIIVGVASHSLYTATTASADTTRAPKSMTEFKQRYLADMQKRVGINDTQKEAVSRILDDTKRKYDDLHASEKPVHERIQQEHLAQIRAVLDEKQRVAFDQWHAERLKAAAAKSAK